MRRFPWAFAACALVALGVAASAAQAQNRGVYPLGMSALGPGNLPDPGFTYANQLLYYSRDRAKDDAGNTSATGANAVLMDMNTVTWVSRWSIAGLRYAASATLPFARNSLTSDLQGQINGGSGLADSYYLPVILGWTGNGKTFRVQYGFLAPTGSFTAGADDNVGSGYWTHAFSSGQTFQLGTGPKLTLSAFEMYEVHTEQEGTSVQPGDTFDLDYSLMYALPSLKFARLQAGIVGYGARQATGRSTGGAPSTDDRYVVNGFGAGVNGAFPKQRASLGFKYFNEFANRSTYEGFSIQVVGAIAF